MKAALYALHYIHSTHDYGISFTSDSVAPMHSYIHFPPSTDVEAYTDALPPTPTTSSTLSSYSDVCWGSQNECARGGQTRYDGVIARWCAGCSRFIHHVLTRGGKLSRSCFKKQAVAWLL
jgi:hypothetical protein